MKHRLDGRIFLGGSVCYRRVLAATYALLRGSSTLQRGTFSGGPSIRGPDRRLRGGDIFAGGNTDNRRLLGYEFRGGGTEIFFRAGGQPPCCRHPCRHASTPARIINNGRSDLYRTGQFGLDNS